MEALDLENQSLKKELAELHKSVAQGDEVDSPVRRSEVNGLKAEIKRLRREVDRLANVSSYIRHGCWTQNNRLIVVVVVGYTKHSQYKCFPS